MEQGELSLKWSIFHSNFESNLYEQYKESSSSDVTLVSDDKIIFQAHKVVLSASSIVIKNILLDNPHSNPVIFLRGVNHKDMKFLLQFMYRGEISIHAEQISSVLEKAKELQIEELVYNSRKENHGINLQDETVNMEIDHFPDFTNPLDISQNENCIQDITNDTSASLELLTPTTKSPDFKNHSLNCGECGAIFKHIKNLDRHQNTEGGPEG